MNDASAPAGEEANRVISELRISTSVMALYGSIARKKERKFLA